MVVVSVDISWSGVVATAVDNTVVDTSSPETATVVTGSTTQIYMLYKVLIPTSNYQCKSCLRCIMCRSS